MEISQLWEYKFQGTAESAFWTNNLWRRAFYLRRSLKGLRKPFRTNLRTQTGMLFEPYFEHSSKWTNLVPSAKKVLTLWTKYLLVAGWPGLDKGTLFLFYMCGRAIHITHRVCKKSVPFLRTEKIGYFRASNSQRHALGMLSWAGSSQRPSTKCRQRLSLVRSLGRPCSQRHALGMLSLAGSVPAPCERQTYTQKQNPNIFMQWGWELSRQWSAGEFRQIRGMKPKTAKGQHWATENYCIWFAVIISTVGSY